MKENEIVKGGVYKLKIIGEIEKLIFIKQISFCMQEKKNVIAISYSEVYGYFESVVFADDIQLLRRVPMTKEIRNRLKLKEVIK